MHTVSLTGYKIAFEKAVRRMNPVTTPENQREGVAALRSALKQINVLDDEHAVYKLLSPTGDATEVPETVLFLLKQMIEVLARGDAITVVPVARELTTQQAADILNVSLQYVVRLLDKEKIPCRHIGTHRRIRVEDLLEFKQRRDQNRMAALDDLTRLSQEYGDY